MNTMLFQNTQAQSQSSLGLKKIWIVLLLILASIIDKCSCHKCIHDKIKDNQPLVYIDDSHLQPPKGRLLQEDSYGPIRFHYEYNTTTINDGDTVGRNLKKIMNIIG